MLMRILMNFKIINSFYDYKDILILVITFKMIIKFVKVKGFLHLL